MREYGEQQSAQQKALMERLDDISQQLTGLCIKSQKLPNVDLINTTHQLQNERKNDWTLEDSFE